MENLFPGSLGAVAGVVHDLHPRPQLPRGCSLLQLLLPRFWYLPPPLAVQPWDTGMHYHPSGSPFSLPFTKDSQSPCLSMRPVSWQPWPKDRPIDHGLHP